MKEPERSSEEVAAQAVYSLLGVLNAAQDIAKLLPSEPAEFRSKVVETLAIAEIALLRFKMELHFVGEEDLDSDGEGLH